MSCEQQDYTSGRHARAVHRLEDQVAETDRQIEAINRGRSLSQSGAAEALTSVHADWTAQAWLCSNAFVRRLWHEAVCKLTLASAHLACQHVMSQAASMPMMGHGQQVWQRNAAENRCIASRGSVQHSHARDLHLYAQRCLPTTIIELSLDPGSLCGETCSSASKSCTPASTRLAALYSSC